MKMAAIFLAKLNSNNKVDIIKLFHYGHTRGYHWGLYEQGFGEIPCKKVLQTLLWKPCRMPKNLLLLDFQGMQGTYPICHHSFVYKLLKSLHFILQKLWAAFYSHLYTTGFIEYKSQLVVKQFAQGFDVWQWNISRLFIAYHTFLHREQQQQPAD